MRKFDAKRIVSIALLVALQIVLSRFFSVTTPIVKIGFAFLPLALTAMLYGPLYAGAAAAAADFIGATVFPVGAYFPGFTLTAFLTGLVYGLFLFRRPKSWQRVGCAVIIISLALHLGLNTVWLWMITGKGFFAILPARLLQNAVMLPVQAAAVYIMGRKVFLNKIIMASACGADT